MNKRRLTSVMMLLLAAVVLFAFEWQIERTAIFKAQEVQKEQVRELATGLQLRMVSQFSQDLRLLYGLERLLNPILIFPKKITLNMQLPLKGIILKYEI